MADEKAISYELGTFTWTNEFEPKSQKGWELTPEIREKISNGSLKVFEIALDADVIKQIGILGGIEIMLNYDTTGQKHHEMAFRWNWNSFTNKGGWITYADLLKENCTVLSSGIIYIEYNITSHPYYNAFKKAMAESKWGILAIQRWGEVDELPIVKAQLKHI